MKHYSTVYELEKDGVILSFKSEQEACDYLGVVKCSVASCYRRDCKCRGYTINRIGIKPLEIIGFEVDYTKRICKYYCSGGDYTPAWFNPAEIGKTVFLTREEAEKALKEREENA